MDAAEWFSKYGWDADPFTFKIYPNIFIGYDEQVAAVKTHLAENHKIALISGPTGSGKTTLLKWLSATSGVKGFKFLYLSKPPNQPEQFVEIFTECFPLNFIERLFRKITLFNLANYVNKKTRRKKFVLLLDEAHETSRDTLEWLRVLTDQIDSMSLVVTGLPVLEQRLKQELETLNQRITTRVRLDALSQSETLQLIKKRIEAVGGKDIKPFTEEAVKAIYEKTGGFPREILRLCNKLVNDAIARGTEEIDIRAISEYKELPEDAAAAVSFLPTPSASSMALSDMPYKQRKILEILSKKEWLTPSAIAEEIGTKAYKTEQHAIRSMNNILKRLLIDGFVQRESRGKSYIYSLTPKIRTLLVQA